MTWEHGLDSEFTELETVYLKRYIQKHSADK